MTNRTSSLHPYIYSYPPANPRTHLTIHLVPAQPRDQPACFPPMSIHQTIHSANKQPSVYPPTHQSNRPRTPPAHPCAHPPRAYPPTHLPTHLPAQDLLTHHLHIRTPMHSHYPSTNQSTQGRPTHPHTHPRTDILSHQSDFSYHRKLDNVETRKYEPL